MIKIQMTILLLCRSHTVVLIVVIIRLVRILIKVYIVYKILTSPIVSGTATFHYKKTENQMKCTTLVDAHNLELNPTQIVHLNARYRQFNDEMMQDLEFFTDCKVAPIIQLEILKKNIHNMCF